MAARASAGSGRARAGMKIRKDDHVKVISGKDRGKTGRVLRAEPRKERLFVEGLNMVKRHTRPRETQGGGPYGGTGNQLGGVIEREGPIHISNVMLLDAKGNPTRIAIERADGKRVRVAKSNGAALD